MILRFEEDFPGREGLQARRELPQHADDSRRGQRAGREQHRRAPRRNSSRSRARGRADHASTRRRPSATKRATSSRRSRSSVRDGAAYRDFLVLYRTNAQSRVFEEALHCRRHSLPRRRRRRLLRAHRNQRRHRLPALHRESVRRACVQAHRQRAAPRHRPADAGGARATAANAARVSVGEADFR